MRLLQTTPKLLSLLILFSCGEKELFKEAKKSQDNEIVTTQLSPEKRQLAEMLGIQINGDVIITLTGSQKSLEALELESFLTGEDVIIEGPEDESPDPENFYLARSDFDLPKLLNQYPTYDGRGVIVGGIDDGVSPSLGGLQKTTTGERKFINRTSSSQMYEAKMLKVATDSSFSDNAFEYTKSYEGPFEKAYQVTLDIEKIEDISGAKEDYNGNGTEDEFQVAVYQTGGQVTACFDINNDQKQTSNECLKPFSQTGEYTYWDQGDLRELTFEFNSETETIKYSEGEVAGDAHGEGVASVMTGHNIGGRFDGVAPGAKYLDYDLSQRHAELTPESAYSIGTFLRALEWMGKEGAEVVNISYSFFFLSAKSQVFMREALERLIEKYNFVLTFSAGNNGPGLGSHNRGAIYPADSLVVGAYLNPELDENVHGVTGLPEEGQVIYYSSIGPGVHGGAGPTVISPLSSLVHSSGVNGFRGFSGTSSAAPAMAGAAAVLISAAKQEGLTIDAGSIVHALRLSATALPEIPFVIQGTGLPKLPVALGIYRKLIEGKKFKDVEVRISGSQPEGISRKGLFYLLSEHIGSKQESLSVQGHISKAAPFDTSKDLIEMVDIEYSHPAIRGPDNLILSTGRSRLFLNIDFGKISEMGEDEVFSEIRLRSKESGELLQVIPVTFVNDVRLNKTYQKTVMLRPQSGFRQHIHTSPGVQAIAVKISDTSQIEGNSIRAIFYDSSRKKVKTITGLKPGLTYFFTVDRPGHSQFTLSRRGGTDSDARIQIEFYPISLSLPSRNLRAGESRFPITNHSKSVAFALTAEKILEPLVRLAHRIEINKPFEISTEINEAGRYRFEFEARSEYPTTYPRKSCLRTKTAKDGKITKSFSTTTSFSDEEIPGKMTVKCYPFDMTDKEVYGQYYVTASIIKAGDSKNLGMHRLDSGQNYLDFSRDSIEALDINSRYRLKIMPLLDSLDNNKSSPVVIEDNLTVF